MLSVADLADAAAGTDPLLRDTARVAEAICRTEQSQARMTDSGEEPDPGEVERSCAEARRVFATLRRP
ncbi:hypothetical protein ACIQMJ_01385 [Actinosynnema sp. NPDC091369]